jgi:hypothetical protein
MGNLTRRAAAGFILGALLLLPGCIKMKMKVLVYPDGSGKVEIVTGLNEALAALGEGGENGEEGEQGLTGMSGDQMMEQSEGIQWATKEEFTEGEYAYSKVVGYFDDINKIKVGGVSFVFEQAEDGSFKLEFADKSTKDALAGQDNPFGGTESEEQKAMIRGMVKAMMSGTEISYEFHLPGEVTEAKEMKMEGRDARYVIDVDKLLDLMENPETAEKGVGGVVLAKPAGDLTEEMAAFKKEMAAAAKKCGGDCETCPKKCGEKSQEKKEEKKKVY